MGDRANFGFQETAGAPIVSLYAHWGGHEMMANLAYALDKARPRWNDSGYATRICISQIIGDRWDDELGYGIYVDTLGDNEHSVPLVNWADRTVSLYRSDFWWWKDASDPKFTMDFDAFINKFHKSLTPA